ncbi:Double-stranded RNA-binding protein [Corchorus capsularis]|uniref:Geranylgeranyl transferase type-2 subunit alpha n=1 Tax=Corchorus capsularis TaxID=210143 RepID=A0A1R3FYB6_COCAP|nr:Double-stranded RNA-binding protein [Corchorus capsularis]
MPTKENFAGVSNCYVFKSRLQEYAQKVCIPTPVYETIKEGPSHEPSFRSAVIVNDVRYDSLPGFSNRKAAEQSAAEVALMELSKSGEVNESISQPVLKLLIEKSFCGCLRQHETGLCKNLLQEYAQKMNYAMPLYVCQKDNTAGRVPHFSCTVEIGGIRYIGAAAKTKKEAEIKAARTALLAIQSSDAEVSSKAVGNSQLTVIPSRKRVAETNSNEEVIGNVPKAKKPRFKKKMSKPKLSGNNDHSQDKPTGTSPVGMDNLVNPDWVQTGSSTMLSSETLPTEEMSNLQDSKPDYGLSEGEMPSEDVALAPQVAVNSENEWVQNESSTILSSGTLPTEKTGSLQDSKLDNGLSKREMPSEDVALAAQVAVSSVNGWVQTDSSTILSSETLPTEERSNFQDSEPVNGLSEREMPSEDVALAPQVAANSENEGVQTDSSTILSSETLPTEERSNLRDSKPVNGLSKREMPSEDVALAPQVAANSENEVVQTDSSTILSSENLPTEEMSNLQDSKPDNGLSDREMPLEDVALAPLVAVNSENERVQTDSSTILSSETLPTERISNLHDPKPDNGLSEREMPSEDVAPALQAAVNSENDQLTAVNSIHCNHEAPDVGTSSMVYAEATNLVKAANGSEAAPMQKRKARKNRGKAKMHGRPRKAAKPEDEAASAAKAQKLRALQEQFFSYHHNKIYTKEAVEISAKLLEINPESYTAWNYRKLAVEYHLSQPESNPDSVKSILDDELRVVESALRQNFKSYGAWHHRKWVLGKGHSSIDHELRLLDKFQKADSRNFHAWNYRRFVAQLMNRSEQDELKYTEDMIYTNFSNYSAWHNRSVLLSSLLEKKAEGFPSKEKVLPEEYEFIHQAIFTDPDDQSGWFYHLWLLDQTVKDDSPILVSSWPAHGSPFTTLHSDSGSLPIVLYFNQPVEGVSSCTVNVESGNGTEDLVWQPLSVSNSQAAQVWVAHLKISTSELHSSVKVSVGHSKGIVSSRGYQYRYPSTFSFKVRLQPVERDNSQGSVPESISWREEDFKVYGEQSQESIPIVSFDQLTIKNDHEPTASNWRAEALAKEIECFRELLSMMDCKIGKLTLARLLMAYDAMAFPCADKPVHLEEVLELYNDLMKLDPSHYRYYKDEHSSVLLKQVTSRKESLLKQCFLYKDSVSSAICNPVCLRLNNLSLSRMGAFEKLLWVQILDLSHNELQSIEGLEAMQLLSGLNLRNNKLRSFTALEPLRKLKSLTVLDISYNQIGEHSIDTTRYLCSSPLSHSAGSEWKKGGTGISDAALSNYWEAFFIFKELNLKQLDIVGNAVADEKFKSILVKVLPTLKRLDGELLD